MDESEPLPPNIARLKRIVIIMMCIMIAGALMLGYAAFEGIKKAANAEDICHSGNITVPKGDVIQSEWQDDDLNIIIRSRNNIYAITIDSCTGEVLRNMTLDMKDMEK